jgi:glycine cleavage system H protein
VATTRIPDDLLYSEQDEWARVESDRVAVGITDYAQQQLGDVVFVELPAVGTSIARGEPFGVIESVKAVSDLFAPLSGEVIAVNEALASRPELVNEDCYGEGWMLVVRPSGDATAGLLDAAAYAKYVDERSP